MSGSVVTNEAVERALKAFTSKSMMDTRELRMRAALEAAAPMLGPCPPLDRGRLDQLWGWAKSGKQPADDGGWYYIMDAKNVDGFTDAVMEMARPMPPTRQIAEAIHGGYCGTAWEECTDTDRMLSIAAARRVLALIHGGAK